MCSTVHVCNIISLIFSNLLILYSLLLNDVVCMVWYSRFPLSLSLRGVLYMNLWSATSCDCHDNCNCDLNYDSTSEITADAVCN